MVLLSPPISTFNPVQSVIDTIAALTALLGSLSTIYTLLVKASQNRNKPKESSPLKFLRLQYQPIGVKDWRRRKTSYLAIAVGCLIALAAYSLVLFLIFPPDQVDRGRLGIYLVFVVVVLFNSLFFFYYYIKLGKTPEEARTFLFTCATVEVEADFETIFAECLRALKQINAYALEFDSSRRYFEASVGANLTSSGGILCIQIDQGNDHRYAIQVGVERRFSLLALASSSWMMTSFLEQFLGK